MDQRPDRKLITILLIVFVQIVGSGMILPILPLYAQDAFGLSPQVITLLVSSFFAAQFLAGPVLGRLSDRYGRLPVLIISQIGTALSFWALGAANAAWVLFASRIFDGITGGNIIVAQAYITDITPREKRAQSLGYIFAAFGLGFIIGPAAGGLLARAFGPRTPYYIAAVAALLVVALTWFTLDESLPPEKRAANSRADRPRLGFGDVVSNGALMMALSIAFIGQFALGMLQATFSLFGDAVIFADLESGDVALGVGALLAVVGLTQFLTQTLLLRRLLLRFEEATLVAVGTVVRAGGMVLFAMATGPLLGVFGSILFPLGMGIMMPPLQSITTRTTDESLRGGVLGLYQSAVSLATIVSTAVGGVLFAIAPAFPFWLGALLSALTAVPALWLGRWCADAMAGAEGAAEPEPAATG
jgi:DHA1 family tetracycline resistance protein-like MFS transporter